MHSKENKNYKVGDCIKGYKLTLMIGDGRLSKIFKANYKDSINTKSLAIKIYNPPFPSQDLKTSFLKEQSLLSTIKHPNIINLHHDGETAQHDPFFVMDYVEDAMPLDEYVSLKNCSIKEIIQFIIIISRALEHLHDNQILYRNINPSNILIDNQGTLKIIDFSQALSVKTNKFKTGEIFFNAASSIEAPPEQILSKQYTIQSEIYSLALLCLKLINKKNIFTEDRIITHCKNDSNYIRKALDNIKSEKDLKNILSKALNSKLKNRYLTVLAFSSELDNWLINKQLAIRQIASNKPTKSFFKYQKLVLFTAFILLLLSVYFNNEQSIKITNQKERASTIENFFLDIFKYADYEQITSEDILAKDLLDKSVDKLQKDKSINLDIKHEVLLNLSEAYRNLGEHEEALQISEKSIHIKQTEKSIFLYARLLYENGMMEKFAGFMKSIDFSKFEDTELKIQSLRYLAAYLSTKGQYKEAERLIKRLISQEKHLTTDEQKILNYQVLSIVYNNRGMHILAAETLQKAFIKYPDFDLTPTMLGIKMQIGSSFLRAGKVEKALTNLNEVHNKLKKIYPKDHVGLSSIKRSISHAYYLVGDFKKTKMFAKESYRLRKLAYGENSLQTVYSLNLLSKANIHLNPPKAIEQAKKMSTILVEELGEDHPHTLTSEENLAEALNINGQHEEAHELINYVLKKKIDNYGVKSIEILHTLNVKAKILYADSKQEQAITTISEAIEIAKNINIPESRFLSNLYKTKADFLFQEQKYLQAKEMYQNYFKTTLDSESTYIYKMVIKRINEIESLSGSQ